MHTVRALLTPPPAIPWAEGRHKLDCLEDFARKIVVVWISAQADRRTVILPTRCRLVLWKSEVAEYVAHPDGLFGRFASGYVLRFG